MFMLYMCRRSLEFCNETLLMHQLRALKEAGISEVLICVHERVLPASWDAYVAQVAQELQMLVECVIEDQALGNAGAFKAAEAKILADGNEAPFIVVNSDVLCTYPLRDLLHTHMKHARECTVLTTRCTDTDALRNYGVVVIDERTGRVRHFVYKPQTFVSDVINAGVYVFSPCIFKRIEIGHKVFMQDILVSRCRPLPPTRGAPWWCPHSGCGGGYSEDRLRSTTLVCSQPGLANSNQLQSCLLSGHWVKMTDVQAFLGAVGPHLEIMRFMKPEGLTGPPDDGSCTHLGPCYSRAGLASWSRAGHEPSAQERVCCARSQMRFAAMWCFILRPWSVRVLCSGHA